MTAPRTCATRTRGIDGDVACRVAHAASINMLLRVSIIFYQEVSTFDGPPGILVAPIVGHRLTMLVFTNRQVRNRLLISAFHIKTPSLLSHCLFHLTLHLPPFIHVVRQFAPGQSLRLAQLCDFVFTPPTHPLSRSNFASGSSPPPIEFLPQFCHATELMPLSQQFGGGSSNYFP